jgi:AbrB family looped-hinge helix DNA binding protein
MRITSKGQVTIPQDIREKAGLLPGTDVEFVYEDGVVRLKKAPTDNARAARAARAIERLKGSGDIRMTTDEIMALMRGDPAEV